MQPITTDEIIEACQVHTPELVKEIWARAQERASYELDRQKLLDGKATSLLQAVGLSLTLAIGLGCQVLLGKHNPLATLDSWHTVALVAALILAVCCALGSSILATRALGVRFDYERLTERGVFNKDELAAADGKAFVKVGPDEEFKLSNPLAAVATYQRYLLPAIWALAQKHGQIHDRKAQVIRCAQNLFVAFLAGLVIIGVLILGTVAHRLI